MWNGKTNAVTALLGGALFWSLAEPIAIHQTAWAARTQDYTPDQFISVLNGLGYPVPLTTPFSSPSVQQSIRDFQVQYRLPVDGTLNLPTQDLAADLMKKLQTDLNRVVKLEVPLPGSQFYGRQTEAAVRLFQQQNKLPVTGIATLETRQRINDILNDALPRPGQPGSSSGSSSGSTSGSTSGSSGSSNSSLGIYTEGQLRSLLLGFGYDVNPQQPLTDVSVVRAIQDIQSLYNLPPTGRPDQRTQEIMATLVRNLRNSLRIVLRSNLPITQFYDAPTQAAVREFQSRYGLPVNGAATLVLRSRIDAEARRVSR
ncbi:MAG: peptidoglycan-binding protein [Myxacorys chilensis ATA2-1-KO14]|jgi:peptidoglycan hydrolase-like protein with peptidoglycan-binding domain|nr:peptidoglycan-binding protein [Myxacorys chilensis ATA2-1-KO14]